MSRGLCVWVTGASSGIGAALAVELAQRGHQVAITARREDRLQLVAARAAGIHPVAGDVTDAQGMRDVVARVTELVRPIDVAVLNAGTYRPVTLDEFGAVVVREHFEVNVLGIVNCLEACLPQMRERRSGHVAVMASVTALVGFPLAAAYGSTKAYLANMGESLRPDLAAEGIAMSVIFPGFVRTELTDQNEFEMPWIIDSDRAARVIADGLAARRAEIGVPRKVLLATRAFAALPGVVRRRVLARIAARRRAERRR